MSKSKNRRENADKIRKQTPHPHGHIASLKQLSDQYDTEHSTGVEPQQP